MISQAFSSFYKNCTINNTAIEMAPTVSVKGNDLNLRENRTATIPTKEATGSTYRLSIRSMYKSKARNKDATENRE